MLDKKSVINSPAETRELHQSYTDSDGLTNSRTDFKIISRLCWKTNSHVLVWTDSERKKPFYGNPDPDDRFRLLDRFRLQDRFRLLDCRLFRDHLRLQDRDRLLLRYRLQSAYKIFIWIYLDSFTVWFREHATWSDFMKIFLIYFCDLEFFVSPWWRS